MTRRPSPPILSESEIERKLAEAAEDARRNEAATAAKAIPLVTIPRPVEPVAITAMAETAEEAQEREARRRAVDVAYLLKGACIPERYAEASLDDVSRVPLENRAAWLAAATQLHDAVRGGSVVGLCGVRGPGKTHMACALVRDCCCRLIRARYTTAMDIFLAIKSQYSRQGGDEAIAERQFIEPALLVIDEIQVRGETPWEDVRLTHLIDTRYAKKRTTVLITNLTRQKLRESVGDSIASRFFDGGGVIECAWPSLRGRLLEGGGR